MISPLLLCLDSACFPIYLFTVICQFENSLIMFSLQDLMDAFAGNVQFAWQVLYSEIMLESTISLQTQNLIKLIELYSQGLEKLNTLQSSQNNYFKNKINQLMGEKKVIHCLHTEKRTVQETKAKEESQGIELEGYKPKGFSPLDGDLLARKKELEVRLAYDVEESKNGQFKTILKEKSYQEEKLKNFIQNYIDEEQQKLKKKIQQRQMRIESSKKISKIPRLSIKGFVLKTQNSENMKPHYPLTSR